MMKTKMKYTLHIPDDTYSVLSRLPDGIVNLHSCTHPDEAEEHHEVIRDSALRWALTSDKIEFSSHPK